MNSNQSKNNVLSAQLIRQRRMALVMPILIIPFLTLAFWAMSGGSVKHQGPATDSALNLQLPDAHLKDDSYENKLSFYEQADADSIRLGNATKTNPFFSSPKNNDSIVFNQKDKSDISFPENTDPNEIKVYQKLAALNQQINASPQINAQVGELKEIPPVSANTNDVKKLDHLLQNMNAENNTASDDEDINKLDGMMDKIITIQHPERVTAANKEQVNNSANICLLDKISTQLHVTTLDTNKNNDVDNRNTFFGLDDDPGNIAPNAIEAVVHDEQTLTSGSVIKLRLLSCISIKGNVIPASSFVYGIATLNEERLNIHISSVRSDQSLFPVNINVYDLDGLPGIYIPGAISRDVSKQSVDNASQMMTLSSLDPSLKMQAASAGIDAAKNLLSKKVKILRVTVKAGYKILLKENKNY